MLVDKALEEWQPEYANFMIESCPRAPFTGLQSCIYEVEANLRKRRKEINAYLNDNEILATISCFPLLGCPKFTYEIHRRLSA